MLITKKDETLVHLFCGCGRLGVLFNLLKQWYLNLGKCFSFPLFIFGPRYSVKKKTKTCFDKFCVWSS